MRTRLKDIAEDLNISTGLVSGVLNGRENVWASEATRRRIFESAKRLNYIPNVPVKPTVAVRGKRQAPAGKIELVFCRGTQQSSAELVSVVESLSAEAERHRLVFVVSGMSDLRGALEYLGERNRTTSDPVVLWGTQSELDLMGKVLEVRGVPFVVCGDTDRIESSWSQGSINYEEMIRGAVDHVRVQGHQSIAFISAGKGSERDQFMRSTFLNWTQSCLGRSVPESFVIAGSGLQDYSQKISRLLELPQAERPTGFVLACDTEGWLALETCLAVTGEKLGFGRSMVGAAGLVERPFYLLFGDALGYDLTDSSVFMSSIRPLFRELASNGVCRGSNRQTPRLSRIPSLRQPLPTNLTSPQTSSLQTSSSALSPQDSSASKVLP